MVSAAIHLEASSFGNGNQPGGGGVSAFGGNNSGGGLFSIPPESVVALKFDSVCLAHGRPTPRVGMKYELRPIESLVKNEPALVKILSNFDRSLKKRKAVQAAAWHLANNMSWQQLSTKSLRVLGQPTSNYFSKSDIHSAKFLVSQASKKQSKKPKTVVRR